MTEYRLSKVFAKYLLRPWRDTSEEIRRLVQPSRTGIRCPSTEQILEAFRQAEIGVLLRFKFFQFLFSSTSEMNLNEPQTAFTVGTVEATMTGFMNLFVGAHLKDLLLLIVRSNQMLNFQK